MFANFIQFIIVLLIYTTYQPPEQTYFGGMETLVLFSAMAGLFILLTWLQFQGLERRLSSASHAFLDHRFNVLVTRQSVLAILLFALNIYGLNLPSFLRDIPVLAAIPTLEALIFLGLFVAYLAVVWSCAHGAYRQLYAPDVSRQVYVRSNISFNIPVLLPWLLLSGFADIIRILPFETPKNFLATNIGEITYFLFFLLTVAIAGPALIQKFWRCKPLENGEHRLRIEHLCQKAGLKYNNILRWPIFGGRMITAGVMGLVKRFRYILVTGALLRYLNPEEIDAVIAHEIGHIKRNHLLFYLLFFIGYMLVSLATLDLIVYFLIYSQPLISLLARMGLNQTTVVSVLFSLIIILIFLVYFRYIFGYFMRNFERQADGYVYRLFDSARPLITTLQKIAAGSGQAPDRPNWHHFSISQRIAFLSNCETDKTWLTRHDRKVRKSIATYALGILVVGGIAFHLNYGEMGTKLNSHFFEKIIQREITKSPENGDLYGMLGDLYYTRNDYAKTIEAYTKALALAPDNTQVLNNLAWLYATSENSAYRNPPQALQLARRAADVAPTPQVLDTLAECYFVNGKLKEATAAGKRALDQANTNRRYFEKQLEKFENALDGQGT